jgi:hypothetical protein
MVSQRLLDILKATGAVSGGFILIAGGLRWLFEMFRRLTEIDANVKSLMNNHLPHINNSLDAHVAAFHGLKADIRSLDTKLCTYGTRLDDTNQSVKSLNDAFIQHIESSEKRFIKIENVPKRKK